MRPLPRHTVRFAALAACLTVALTPAAVLAAGDDRTATTDTTLEQDRPKPTERQRQMRGELKDLASAWADGGGTFGYPFWE